RGDCGDHLAEGNRQWVIPGTDDADYAERLVGDGAGFGFRGEAVMRHRFGPKQPLGVLCEIFRGVERDENVGEESFDAGLAGFDDDGIGQDIARGKNALAENIKSRRALARREFGPVAGGDAGLRYDLREQRGRGLLKVSKGLAGRGIDRRESVDAYGCGSHRQILTENVDHQAGGSWRETVSGRTRTAAEAQSSGKMGSTTVLGVDGSSRSLRYSPSGPG